MMLRDADPVMLRDLLAEIAEHHAFSWDADAMLRRVADEVRERMG